MTRVSTAPSVTLATGHVEEKGAGVFCSGATARDVYIAAQRGRCFED